jgi:hypothetical protein
MAFYKPASKGAQFYNPFPCFSYHQILWDTIRSMKRIVLYLLTYCWSLPLLSATGAEPVQRLVDDFVSSDWPVVLAAKQKLESLGAVTIPEMIRLMDNCSVQKLMNTGDLIYPGAEKFFGHGQIIDYDIDNLCIRAGWLVEEMTFIDFGFSGAHLPAGELTNFIKNEFPVYFSNTENQQQIILLGEEEKRALIRSLSVEKVKRWWPSVSKQWSRLAALEQALNSSDEKSQVMALFYLRNGNTACKGLDQKFYRLHLAKVVERLSKAQTNRVSENAKLIMLDNDFTWLTLKPVN